MNTWTSVFFCAVIMTVSAQTPDNSPARPPPETAGPPPPETAGPPPEPTCAPQPASACAPQPVVIQLSCGGSNQGQTARPPPPPQRPVYPAPPPPGYATDNMCNVDDNGYATGTPPGGFPAGFRMMIENGEPVIVTPPGFPRPPANWDGRPETLGFPAPEVGTPAYNMLLCWPIPVPTGRK